jgi:hypothetical protein
MGVLLTPSDRAVIRSLVLELGAHPTDPADLLDLLRALGAIRSRNQASGHLSVRHHPAWARRLVAPSTAKVAAAILTARRTGHIWARCDGCGTGILLAAGRTRPCVLTPGCEGLHRAPEPRNAETGAFVDRDELDDV